MAHSEHNRSKSGSWFALIIFGAIMLFLAPTIYPKEPEMGTVAFVAGLVIGGLGFFLRFIRNRGKYSS